MKRPLSPDPAESYSYEDSEESSPECDVEIGDPNHGVVGREIEVPQPEVGRKVPSPVRPDGRGPEIEPTKEENNQNRGGRVPVVPARVQEALDKAKDFGEFRDLRTFVFVHYFSGPEDKLAEAIVRTAEKAGLKVEVISLDIKIDKNADLSKLEVYELWEARVEQGELDGSHAGFPCGSFSRVRWVPGEGLPPPVRSLEEIYGLSSNDESQQREADRGTLLASRSAWLMQKQVKSQRDRGVPEVATLENPPGSKDQHEGPAWKLPELMGPHNQGNVNMGGNGSQGDQRRGTYACIGTRAGFQSRPLGSSGSLASRQHVEVQASGQALLLPQRQCGGVGNGHTDTELHCSRACNQTRAVPDPKSHGPARSRSLQSGSRLDPDLINVGPKSLSCYER